MVLKSTCLAPAAAPQQPPSFSNQIAAQSLASTPPCVGKPHVWRFQVGNALQNSNGIGRLVMPTARGGVFIITVKSTESQF